MSSAMVDFRSPLQNPNPSAKGQAPSPFTVGRPFNLSQPNMPSSTDGSSRNFDANGSFHGFNEAFTSPLPNMAPSISGTSRPRLVKVRRHLGSQQSKTATPNTAARVEPGFNPFRPVAPVSDSSDRVEGGRMWHVESKIGSSFNLFRSNVSFSDGSDGTDEGKMGVSEGQVDSGFDLFRPKAPVSAGLDQVDDGKMQGARSRVDLGFNASRASLSVSDGLDRGNGTGLHSEVSRGDFGFNLLRSKASVSDGSDQINDVRMRATKEWAETMFKPGSSFFCGSDKADDERIRPMECRSDSGLDLSRASVMVSSGMDGVGDKTQTLRDQLYSWNPFSSQVAKDMDGSSCLKGNFEFGKSNDPGFKSAAMNSSDSGSILPDEMRKLKIGSEMPSSNVNSPVFTFTAGSKGSSSSSSDSNLNLGEIPMKADVFIFGSNVKKSSKPGVISVDETKVSGLPDEMRKLQIQEKAKDDNHSVPTEEKVGFVFGSDKNDTGSFGGSMETTLPDGMKKLNIGSRTGVDKSKVSGLPDEMRKLKIEEKAKDGNFSSKKDEKLSFVFGSNKNLTGSFGQNTDVAGTDTGCSTSTTAVQDESKISKRPNETRKLKIEEKAKDANIISTMDDNIDIVFGGNKNIPDNLGFVFSSDKNFTGTFGGSTDTVATDMGRSTSTTPAQNESRVSRLPDEMGNLKIEENAEDANLASNMDGNIGFVFGRNNSISDDTCKIDTGHSSSSSSMKDSKFGNKGYGVFSGSTTSSTSFPAPFPFQSGIEGNSLGTGQVPPIELKSDPSLLSSKGPACRSAGNIFNQPTGDQVEKKPTFCFTSTREGSEIPQAGLGIPNQNAGALIDSLFTGLRQTLEVSAKRGTVKSVRLKKKRGKLRPLHQRGGTHFISSEKSSQENSELGSPGSYSPMDFSPYQEKILAADQCSRETSVASDQSVPFATTCESMDARQSVHVDVRDEDLLDATENLNINENDLKSGGFNDERSKQFFKDSFDVNCLPSEKKMGSSNNDINIGGLGNEGGNLFYFSSRSEDSSATNFTFAATPPMQRPSSSAKRNYRKKNRGKVVAPEPYSSTPNAKVGLVSPSPQFFPLSSSLQPGHIECQKGEMAVSQNEADKDQENMQESITTAAATAAAQEACEKWRLRGNQAYSSGNLSKAEDYYTRGVACVPPNETTRSCVRALMLCYSNRAATRMALGRMREALSDCMMAASMDPNFLRVQVRAANCYLALGEIEEALKHFKKCLQAGNDVSFDQKIRVEASDGLRKAQQVAEYMDRSLELLHQRTSDDAADVIQIITEALSISPYSDILFEMKAEALSMLRKYEEVVQLCDQTLDSAERNSATSSDGGSFKPVNGSESVKNYSVRIWRWRLMSKSYFYMGRLEEALDILQKHEKVGPIVEKFGSKIPESPVSFAATVRELLRHKAAGNEAFQAGRHSEAVEHYTVAIACNVESRPFTAICFCNRAAAYQALGQITDAIADCSLAIALDSNYPKAISRRATLHEMIRDYGQAINDLHRLISLHENQTEDKVNQSGTLGRSSSSVNDLRQARLRLATMEEEARKEIPLDMYLILGIEPSCTASDIKKAYRKAALRHHPDKAGQFLARSENGDDGVWKEVAEEVQKDADRLFKMIGEAYAVISDPTKRLRYDAEEEMRNAQKKGNGSGTPKTPGDEYGYPFEKSGMRRQWRDTWKSYGSTHQRWSDTSRSNR